MALTNYNRATDETHLVRDRNVEVLELFYAPYVEDEGDLSIGDGDPDKAGAIASVLTGGEVKLAVYQGDGTWKIVGGSSAPTYTPDPSLPDPPTLSYLNTNYPTAKPGDTVYWEGTTQIVTATCYAVGEWKWITENRCQ